MMLQCRQRLAGPVLQVGVFTALGVALEQPDRILVRGNSTEPRRAVWRSPLCVARRIQSMEIPRETAPGAARLEPAKLSHNNGGFDHVSQPARSAGCQGRNGNADQGRRAVQGHDARQRPAPSVGARRADHAARRACVSTSG